jgi:hypothetical protein
MHTNQTPLHSANIAHTTRAIIMCVHVVHTLSCVCTLCASITHESLYLHCAMLNLAHASAYQHFSVRHQNLACAPAHQHFSALCQNFSARTYMPTSFHAVPNIYISQDFHCASCIFSAPTYAHSFLCTTIPHEFRCKNWGFFL